MEKDIDDSAFHNASPKSEEDSEKSFVGKVKSMITNTPLSKWFRRHDSSSNSVSTIRRRNDDAEDDEIHQMQPPSKRVKFPPAEKKNHLNIVTSINTSDLGNVDNKQSSQKSNHFPEPVAGPSGIKTRKLLPVESTSRVKNKFNSSEILNGHKDSDSEESTSGYSSVPRIGSKDNVCHSQESFKPTSPQQNPNKSRSLFQNPNTSTNRSLFADSTHTSSMNTSMTTRRPSFNASTFGSPNFIDKTIATEKIINSPFYSGRTIYGGASAYGRRLGRSARDLRTSLKRSVQIKPVNKPSETGSHILGKTARRILETLEQYSSPINDAKKIPVASKRFKSDSLLSNHVGASPYKNGDTPSKKELQVPTVSELLKMKQKTRLQNSTETVRQIAISSKSDLNSEQNLLSEEKLDSKSEANTDVPEQKKKDDSMIETVNSSAANLPTTTLPKFDFFKPSKSVNEPPVNIPPKVPPTQTTVIVNTPPKVTIETDKNVQKEVSESAMFKFSAPLVIAENMKSIKAMNNFKFSKPISNLTKIGNSNEKETNTTKNKNNIKMSSKGFSSLPNEKEKTPDINNSSSFGIKNVSQWECKVCMVRNNDKDSQCVCCTASKPSVSKTDVEPTKTIPSSFGNKFTLPTSMWECSVCMIRNENSNTKCSACETPNPKTLPNLSTSSNHTGLIIKSQTSASTWECNTCLIKNKNEVDKCIACESPRIGIPAAYNSLCSTFKKKDDEWECQVCMVKNKITNAKCQCCESLKPGSNPENSLVLESEKKPIPKFNFGIDKATAASFSFGVPSSASVTLPKPAVDPAIVFGENAKKTTTETAFTFGVKPEVQSNKTNLIVPPINAETKDVSEQVEKTVEKTDASVPIPKFQFGSVSQTSTQNTSLINEKVVTEAKPVVNTTEEATKPTFNFSVVPSSSNELTKKVDTAAKDTFKSPPAKLFSFGSKSLVTSTATLTPTSGVSTVQSIQANQTSAAVANQITISKPSFSFGVSKTTADSSSSIFGAKTTLTNTTFAPANFGSPISTVTPALKTNSDVNVTVTVPPPVPSFGGTTTTFGNASKPSFEAPFSFGGATAPTSGPPAKAPMFSFGQSAGATQVPQSTAASSGGGFNMNFGAANSSTPSFNFTMPKTTETPNSGVNNSNIFGSAGTNNTEVTNRVFNFGASSQTNNTQKAGFSFGAHVDNKPVSAPTQSGFSFGAAAPKPKPAGGFNFSAAANFDGTLKPSFNFADAPVTAFTAQPSADGGIAPPRKIKRAVRRTQR